MAAFQHFEEIEAWQEGRKLIQKVYQVTRSKDFKKDRSLQDQLRRSACSITANIAEGFERGANSEFIYFLSIAKGSAGEVRSLIYTALDERYVSREEFRQLYDLSTVIIKKLAGLIKYLKNSEIKGTRYKKKE